MNPSLFRELERVLDCSERALLCAVSFGRVTLDGYTLKVTDDRRWSARTLRGRMATFYGREGRVFGMSQVCRTPATGNVATTTTT